MVHIEVTMLGRGSTRYLDARKAPQAAC